MRAVLLSVAFLLGVAPIAQAVDKANVDAAVDRGVAALKKLQRNDGTWPHDKVGATSLAGLTLLECGVADDDKSVVNAAAAVRKAALNTLDTYSLCLDILFLDRLDKPEDTPLIEAMIVNLLAGQLGSGGWDYNCVQAFNGDEGRLLLAEAGGDRELKGGRDLSKLTAKGKRGAAELPRLIQGKLVLLANRKVENMGVTGDNSNTQFATLALWAGRRYGVPTHGGLVRTEQRYRTTQIKDGSWGYTPQPIVISPKEAPVAMPGSSTGSAAMTCAGLLGLACGHGAKADARKNKDGKISIDVSTDKQMTAGLQVLSSAVGEPIGWKGDGAAPDAVAVASGKAYYYLWSLERICVVLGLDTLGKKDWYNWGAEILLKSQQAEGGWAGEYAESGCDTCFALMFLKRVNLARDLTSGLVALKDPGERQLKSGGIGGLGLKGKDKGLAPVDIGDKPPREKKDGEKKVEEKKLTETEREAARLRGELIAGKGPAREKALKALRDSKGSEFTEALAAAIPKLQSEAKREAREALADRLTRMRPATLKAYFKDVDPEVRRAAALAAGQKDATVLAPDLIDLLADADVVRVAARAALATLAKKDLGDKPEPWRAWWKTQAKE